jgi:hypothetical protein
MVHIPTGSSTISRVVRDVLLALSTLHLLHIGIIVLKNAWIAIAAHGTFQTLGQVGQSASTAAATASTHSLPSSKFWHRLSLNLFEF